jgi:hypothetical protein
MACLQNDTGVVLTLVELIAVVSASSQFLRKTPK